MDKKTIIQALETIATYMEMKAENPFKISAYRKAALALERDERSLDEITNVMEIKGIGKGTAEVIEELREHGRSTLLAELQAELPEGLISLLNIRGLGGKKIGKLYRELNIVDIESLRQACLDKKVQQVAGFGKKTEENILSVIEEMNKRPERFGLAFALPIAERIERQLAEIEEIEQFSRAGSLRRWKETVKDLDFIIATSEPDVVRERLLSLENISSVIANGATKVSLELAYSYRIQVDFRLVAKEMYATALHHFTGSKEHHVKMRQLAKERGEKISEYGVEHSKTGEVKTFQSEEEFFNYFNLYYIPPEMREDDGEIEAFQREQSFLNVAHIKSDLHVHTTWSDGAHSLTEMVEAAMKRQYTHIAITDHSQFLRVANGLTEARLRQQMEEIDRLNEQYAPFKIFKGIEMDILPDGSLDFPDSLLAGIDFVIAAIHSSFNQDEATIMKRLEAALYNEHVDLIAHPTGRLIERREGYAVNVEKLIELAAETKTALELNSNPHRLDLEPKWLKKAEESGVPIAINTDAHRMENFDYIEIGVAVANKALLKKESIMNTWSLETFERFLARHK